MTALLHSPVSTGESVDSPYGCLLAQQPSHLVPRRLLGAVALVDPTGPVVCSPRAWLDTELPEGMLDATSGVVHRDPWTLWVQQDPGGATLPYLLDAPLLEHFVGLRRAAADGHACSARHLRLLGAIGAIGRPGNLEGPGAAYERRLAVASEALDGGYAALCGLIHPFHLGVLRARYRRLMRQGQLRLGDEQSPRRYVAHNESAATFFHHQLAGVVSRVVGRRVLPSYVYLAGYQPGAELRFHVDRPQCEYTLALCLDFSPEPRCETPWPLQLRVGRDHVFVYQALGDALLYRGTTLPHGRDELPSGRTSTSLFFHYVDEGFTGPLR